MDKVQHQLRLTHFVHDTMRDFVVQMVMHINNRHMLFLNQFIHLEKGIAAFETDGFRFLVKRQDDTAVVAVVISNHDRSSS